MTWFLMKGNVFISNLNGQEESTIVQKILKMNPRPDAIFATNDSSAVSIIIGLTKAGIRVPGDIAVAGFNNDPLSQVIQPKPHNSRLSGYRDGRIGGDIACQQIKEYPSRAISVQSF